MKTKSKLILIAGGTASGKTTIAREVCKNLKNKNIETTLIQMDNYYLSIDDFDNKKISAINWDHPSAINWKKLESDYRALINNKTLKIFTYDFEKSIYDKTKEIVLKPSEYIVIEGVFALYDEFLNQEANTKIFVSADSDTRLIRRIERDKKIRFNNFDPNSFIKKWKEVIKPMHNKYVQPTSKLADLIVKNSENLEESNSFKENTISSIVNLIK